MEKGIVSEEKNKPAFDEQTLAKLLEAAYVLQEHIRESQPADQGEPKTDQPALQVSPEQQELALSPEPAASEPPVASDLPLAQIVETQHKIQVQHLELEKAMSLVAARIVEIGRAAGAAIGIVNGKSIRYRAVAGHRTPAAATDIPLDKALCIPCIRTGEVFRCVEVTPKTLLDTEECRRRGIQSLVAVPVFHNGSTVGGLELYYSDPRAFTEQDVHSCQLMAGLITEVLAREEEVSWKKSLAGERNKMLEALEKLKSNLSVLADKPGSTSPPPRPSNCAKCGHELVGEEQFCGQCGSARPKTDQSSSAANEPNPLQPPAIAGKSDTPGSLKDSLTVEEQEDIDHILSGTTLDELAKSLENEMPEAYADSDLEIDGKRSSDLAKQLSADLSEKELSAAVADEEKQVHETESEGVDEIEGDEQRKPSEGIALTKPAPTADWSSARSAREFFEHLADTSRPGGLARFWNERRGDVYLVIALILVACVIRWGIWSNPSVNAKATPNAAAAAHHKPIDSDLSLFDRMLISLGLAEAPETPEDKGNPSTQVWVDTHTGLYYCPGTDLYGKTPAGKYASQRDAQLDQFEPASRKACN